MFNLMYVNIIRQNVRVFNIIKINYGCSNTLFSLFIKLDWLSSRRH